VTPSPTPPAEEAGLRRQLAACSRIFDLLRAGPSSSTTTSRRACPGRQDHFLIDPFGLHYSEVRASNLVRRIDLEGRIVGESLRTA
jgi:ribulose-5-phosphate 4-epimerase/fuculose-1-phosphate aldolase